METAELQLKPRAVTQPRHQRRQNRNVMYQRIVVKLGTSVLTGGTPKLDHPHMVELVRQCAELYSQGKDIIICTSGAIAVGRHRLGFPDVPNTVTNKQMFAAVGQSRLMQMWERYFEIYGIHVGQILLTRADVTNRRRYLNARDTLLTLLDNRIVPIINENDAVATEDATGSKPCGVPLSLSRTRATV